MFREFCCTKLSHGSGGGGGDGVLSFYVKTFYLTVSKNFVVEILCF